jgi:hypothetical protein
MIQQAWIITSSSGADYGVFTFGKGKAGYTLGNIESFSTIKDGYFTLNIGAIEKDVIGTDGFGYIHRTINIDTHTKFGNTSTAEKVADVATDFIPIVGASKDIYKGIRDGNGWQVALGAGFLIFDIATLGSGSLVKGGIKTAAKEGAEFAAKKSAYEVYHLVNVTTKKVEYVGITMRGTEKRFTEHLLDARKADWIGNVKPVIMSEGLTKTEARIAEQNWINNFGLDNLNNVRNSIAQSKWSMFGIPNP